MNRYPIWKNALVIVALILGLIYTLPNFFGEAPAVQVSTARSGVQIDPALMTQVESTLKDAAIAHTGLTLDTTGVRVRLADTDTQLKTRDVLEKALNPDPVDGKYVVALNLLSKSPDWLRSFGALPMYLGLDLRGGVHFLLQVDMQGATVKRLDSMSSDLRTQLREQNIRHGGISREGNTIVLRFRDAAGRDAARSAAEKALPEMVWTQGQSGADYLYTGRMSELAETDLRESAIKQNILTLQKRVNELGVAEPIIQQQGADRIVVQLPGVQDVAKAKDLIGRTATLEVRLVDQEAMTSGNMEGLEVYPENSRSGGVSNVPVKKQVILTGERFETAQASFDDSNRPAVAVKLDATGGRIMRTVTRENLKKLMVILLFEKGRGEAISVATIQGEFGDRFQITGQFSPQETNTLAILIRSGALAAPMEIIEERVIGPSLGAENIEKGFDSTLWGFVAIAVFMIFYYAVFGFISTTALAANLLFLIALLSLLQATLTLPGIAAIALTLGMAIDANVLINERIREELRNGVTPQAAIAAGYERAWATILDSNITTLIAGIALLVFGSGPVRGFAVVHCLGILTSMFSAVVVSRAIVNMVYGRARKLEKVSIGTVWKPGANL
ncbi:protein translocase subunit SecD [Methyloversatilis sp. XJ19-13]|uniref:protein translocase subunit SecD n=1 Tax=Methyloversatilis sp. XJ19-13 TaxID=2963430 RepID=UPI00211CA285|nr:protein translocase subunit SecD [Methyloversatilis sp. XJ19-13]MCQ9373093.1 protein translocase subunit SecD [Methyloversatilis sp. XJ19-13]